MKSTRHMLIVAVLSCHGAFASDRSADSAVDFSREILPVLSNKCFVCHGPDADDDALRLDSWATATMDLGGYRAIDTEQPGDSEILARIHSPDSPMPPADAEKQLTSAERELLTRWVQQGGSYSRHWAFVAPKRDAAASIDRLIQTHLQSAGISFAPRADRQVLARRTALALTGLPPEPALAAKFITSQDDGAFEQYMDQLMASPRYGEHQARYWLDAVRYGDTHGLHLDNRRGIFPYRDWVVRAFNQNLPLDQFITWQLAGDLLPQPRLEQLVATGFVRLNPSTSEGGAIPAEFQVKNNFDRTETFGTVFLGMSFTCARCHTHKYDPITQDDYYRLLAFFNSTAESALDGNSYTYEPTVKAPANQAMWDDWSRLEDERRQLIERAAKELRPLPASWESASAADRWNQLADLAAAPNPSGFQREASELTQRMAQLEEQFTTTLVARELDPPRVTRRLHRGEYDQPVGDSLQPGVPDVMSRLPPDVPRDRLGLARWLTSREHPLVSRVLVNRLWQRVFGFGLVRTPEDFGLQGEQPTHPELLDWLAVELQESGWDLQHMLRLMLRSHTFQQSSAWRTDIDDPENRLWARGPGYRLDAEVIRDMALWASGLLQPEMGGEGIKPYQPAGMWMALAHPGSNTKQYVRDEGAMLYRRSLYVYWKRTSPHPMMTLFDAPDRESSCVRRSRTNTALQSLGLLNETQRIEMSRLYAEKLIRQSASDDEILENLFQRLTCRSPSDPERQTCRRLLKAMRDRYRTDRESALALLSQGDAARDEQLDPVEHAAWTQVVITVLASDIALLLY